MTDAPLSIPSSYQVRQAILLRRILRSPKICVGAGILLAFVVLALFAPLILPHGPDEQNLALRLLPPMWDAGGQPGHPFGTDHLGRDVLARLLFGARVSLVIGLGAAGIGLVIGVTLGVLAGYFGGWVDQGVNLLLTSQLALPGLLLAMALVFLIGPSLAVVILVIGLMHWTYFLVVTRSATQRIRELDYVRASRVAGASTFQILQWDVLPNLLAPIMVIFTLEVGMAILAEASLSFLGVGVPAPTATWGLMIAEGKAAMFLRPSLVVLPGLAIFLLVTAVNLLGDGLRDILQSAAKG